jgi:hypothetical protein
VESEDCRAVALAKADITSEIEGEFCDFLDPSVCNFLAGAKNKASHLGVADVIKTINPITTITRPFHELSPLR